MTAKEAFVEYFSISFFFLQLETSGRKFPLVLRMERKSMLSYR